MCTNHLDTDEGNALPPSHHQAKFQAFPMSAAANPARLLYEERETPGKGIGLFATAPIQSGTRVLSEDPLIVLPDEADTVDLYGHIRSLNVEGQKQFWGLAAVMKPDNTGDWMTKLPSEDRGMSTLVFRILGSKTLRGASWPGRTEVTSEGARESCIHIRNKSVHSSIIRL